LENFQINTDILTSRRTTIDILPIPTGEYWNGISDESKVPNIAKTISIVYLILIGAGFNCQ